MRAWWRLMWPQRKPAKHATELRRDDAAEDVSVHRAISMEDECA
jgi:hypothetical protein